MPDSERIFKLKERSRWTVFEISLISAVICIWRVLHGKEIVQYLQNYKHHEVDQGHFKKLLWSSTRVSLPNFLHDFWRNIFPWLYSINWPNLIVWLALFREIFVNVCFVIVCWPCCDFINFEINLLFLLHDQKFKTKI